MFEQTIRPAALKQIERVEALVQSRDDALAIPRVAAEFIHAVILSSASRRGLEVGTSYGYSGLWIGTALLHNGGVLTTIDHNPDKVIAARETFSQAGVAEAIECIEGDAADALAEIDGPFDFVFLDADKKPTRNYFDLIWPKLAHRATIITDNVTSHEDELSEFVAFLRQHPQLCSTLIPVGSGLELTVKLDPYATSTSLDGADWVI